MEEGKVPAPRYPILPLPLEGGGNAGTPSLHQKEGDADRLVQEQVSSIQGLDAFTRDSPEALEEVQRVVKATIAYTFSPDSEPGGTEKRREVDRLVSMASDLGEVVVSTYCIVDCLDTKQQQWKS